MPVLMMSLFAIMAGCMPAVIVVAVSARAILGSGGLESESAAFARPGVLVCLGGGVFCSERRYLRLCWLVGHLVWLAAWGRCFDFTVGA